MSSEQDLDFLTLAQVAEKMRLHPKTLRRLLVDMMVKNQALTVTRIGRSILFTRAQLDELTKVFEWRSPVADLIVRRSTGRHVQPTAQDCVRKRAKQMLQADKEERLVRRMAAIAAVKK